MGTPQRLPMTIGGRAVTGSASFDVLNPATEEVWAQAPECTAAELDDAFAAAAAAGPGWAAEEEPRRAALRNIAQVLTDNVDELGLLLTQEQGKTLRDSAMEIEQAAAWYRYFADVDFDYYEVIEPGAVTGVLRPLGVVAAITPWNFPIALASWKLAPALRTGNTVVLKPSPYTPMSTLRMGELLAGVLPAGVLNVVSGGDEVGVAMTVHPRTAKVSFTGSVEGGKSVAKAVADDLKRVTLELGGNDPAIVLDDADPAAVAAGLFWGAFYNNGQVCGAIKRVYVPEQLADPLADELSAIAASLRVGDGTDPETVLGPLSTKPQFDRIRTLLESALAEGAELRTGGKPVGERGYFLTPTILTGCSAGQAIVDEEQFGPVLPLISYRDLQEAVDQANASKYGLGASVWSSDRDRAVQVGLALDAGTTWINSHAATNGPHVPFGGAKWSGLGVENGTEGLRSFTQLHVIYGDVTPQSREGTR